MAQRDGAAFLSGGDRETLGPGEVRQCHLGPVLEDERCLDVGHFGQGGEAAHRQVTEMIGVADHHVDQEVVGSRDVEEIHHLRHRSGVGPERVHFGFGVTTLVCHHLLRPYLRERIEQWGTLAVLVVLMGSGVGALNEIIEFIAVLTVPETGVGGYENTALDLCFNLLGGILAVSLITLRRGRGESV